MQTKIISRKLLKLALATPALRITNSVVSMLRAGQGQRARYFARRAGVMRTQGPPNTPALKPFSMSSLTIAGTGGRRNRTSYFWTHQKTFVWDVQNSSLMNDESKRSKLSAPLTFLGIALAPILGAIAERLASMLQGTAPQGVDADVPLLTIEQTKELNIQFVLQLNRTPDTRGDHRPVLSDLRDSVDMDADPLIAKQLNGPTGQVKLTFIAEFSKFESRAGDVEDATQKRN